MAGPPPAQSSSGNQPLQTIGPGQPASATWTVAELSAHLTRLLATAFPDDLWVQGQIRNLSRAASGHVYFDLVEPAAGGDALASSLSVTLLAPEKRMVNDVLRRAGGAVRMDDGIEVRIRGRLRWWAPRGQLQLRMSSIDPAWTLGRLAADRDRVLAALAAEGLVDRNRSLPMPLVPLRVGVVTSVGSAAHADFLAELESSSFGFDVRVADARTQGVDCARSIVTALHHLASTPAGVDVVVLIRGGGSRTDLAAFDGAGIARAIATMPVPVLTGIGHEIDSSIADTVAHQSFKTPTAVAANLAERVGSFLGRADELWLATARAADRAMTQASDALLRHGQAVARATRSSLASQEQACAGAGQRLERTPFRMLQSVERSLVSAEAQVRAHDPVRVLARGWSVTRDSSGRVVRSTASVAPGDALETMLADGTLSSVVRDR